MLKLAMWAGMFCYTFERMATNIGIGILLGTAIAYALPGHVNTQLAMPFSCFTVFCLAVGILKPVHKLQAEHQAERQAREELLRQNDVLRNNGPSHVFGRKIDG